MRRTGRGFDILGVVIAPANDDQILDAAGDEELAVSQEPEIAGSQEWSVATLCQSPVERIFREVGPPPVAGSHRRSRDPDFADLVRRTYVPCVRADDQDASVPDGRAAADKMPSGAVGGALADAMLLEVFGVCGEERRFGPDVHASHHQRGFREAVARVELLRAKTAARESTLERVQRVAAHGLGAVVRGLPSTEIKALHLFIGHTLHARVESEVGTAAVRAAMLTDGFQPARRPLNECGR